MAYDENLAARIRLALARKRGVAEKKMFGGVCFLLHGNMLVGVWKEFLIARLGEEQGAAALRVRMMDITGKPMKGWVMVEPAGAARVEQLKGWVQRAGRFVASLPRK